MDPTIPSESTIAPGILPTPGDKPVIDGTGGVPMSAGGDPASLVSLPLSDLEMGAWCERIKRARDRIKLNDPQWDTLMKAYLPVVSSGPEQLRIMTHFRNVHSKIGLLFHRTPEVQLEPGAAATQTTMPDPMNPGQMLKEDDIVTIKQAVLNQHLGRKGVNASRVIDQALFDVLAWTGIAAVKVGYRVVTKPITQPTPPPPPDPTGQTPPPDPTAAPVMQTIRVPIFEEWYLKKLSPKKILFNDDLRSTMYEDDATWMGYDFVMTSAECQKTFGLTDAQMSVINGSGEDDRLFQHENDSGTRPTGLIKGVELVYKASVFSDELHPQAMRHLTILDCKRDAPVVHRPSVDQTFDDQGRLTDDSLIGFPYKILAIRDLTDSPFPAADSAFTNPQVKERNTFRQQGVKRRDAAIGKLLLDEGVFGETEADKIRDGDVGEIILVQAGMLAAGKDRVMATTSQVTATADDYRTEALLKQENDETLGIGSNQAGTPEDTVRSATEIATVQTAVAGRMEKERARVVDFFLSCVEALDTLLMRYATQTEYVKVTGRDGAQKIQAWNSQIIAGKYLYSIKPDSQLFVDASKDRQQFMAWYNLTKGDPLVNRIPSLRQGARLFGMDPSEVIIPPPPQPPGLPPAPQPPHLDSGVDQHQAAQTGGLPNAPGSQGQGVVPSGGGAARFAGASGSHYQHPPPITHAPPAPPVGSAPGVGHQM